MSSFDSIYFHFFFFFFFNRSGIYFWLDFMSCSWCQRAFFLFFHYCVVVVVVCLLLCKTWKEKETKILTIINFLFILKFKIEFLSTIQMTEWIKKYWLLSCDWNRSALPAVDGNWNVFIHFFWLLLDRV